MKITINFFGYCLIFGFTLLALLIVTFAYYLIIVFFAFLGDFLNLDDLNIVLTIIISIIRRTIFFLTLYICVNPLINIPFRFIKLGFTFSSIGLLSYPPKTPHILYLRSFRNDGVERQKKGFLSNLSGSYFLKVNEERGEWKLAKCLYKYCTVIALGNPKELLPPLGFDRLYVQNELWWEMFTKLASKTNLICIYIGRNIEQSSFEKELRYLRSNNPTTPILFFINRVPANEWDKYKNELYIFLLKTISVELILLENRETFITFDKNWNPTIIEESNGTSKKNLDEWIKSVVFNNKAPKYIPFRLRLFSFLENLIYISIIILLLDIIYEFSFDQKGFFSFMDNQFGIFDSIFNFFHKPLHNYFEKQ